jgi:prepilin-type N-terminal cleavage/methylation domain-containing protein
MMTRRRPTVSVRRRTPAAFTLVEVLATLVLIGIVIPVALKGVSVAVNSASHAKHQAEAATLGEGKLSEMIAQGDWSMGAGSGDFGADYPGYTWTCQTATPDPNVNVTEVTVTVTWKERGQDRQLNLSTFIYAAASTGVGGTSGGLQ